VKSSPGYFKKRVQDIYDQSLMKDGAAAELSNGDDQIGLWNRERVMGDELSRRATLRAYP
jgi:hypothetical protein